MTLSDVSIRRPVFTAMMSLAVMVLGFLAYGRLPTDLYPPVDFPILTVQVVYPGASPTDIERDVTKPLEDAVAGISGIDKLQSFTRDSVTFMVLQFEMGTDIDAATNSVRDRIGAVEGDLPAAAFEPVIKQIDIGALPVMVVTLASDGGVNETRELAEERLRPLLEQVAGVGAVNVVGGQDREVRVDLDLDKLNALALAPTQGRAAHRLREPHAARRHDVGGAVRGRHPRRGPVPLGRRSASDGRPHDAGRQAGAARRGRARDGRLGRRDALRPKQRQGRRRARDREALRRQHRAGRARRAGAPRGGRPDARTRRVLRRHRRSVA